MEPDLGEIEHMAKRHSELGKSSESQELAAKIIDAISSEDFQFPLEDDAVVSSGTVTYIYKNNSSCPELLRFLSELLHVQVPIEIGFLKIGPGEILVSKPDRKEADREITESTKELQKLVHAKKAGVLTGSEA